MSEVLFYHLTQSPVEAALPALLEKSLERGWKVVVRGMSRERMEALDRHLWTYREEGFLPHGLTGGAHDANQPILLTTGPERLNDADVLMLIDGAWAGSEEMKPYQRVCAFFDGNDPDAVAAARGEWKSLKEQAFALTYWAQEGGSWVKKG